MENNENTTSLSEELGDIIEDYTQWYNAVIRDLFYKVEVPDKDQSNNPLSNFESWLSRAQRSDIFDPRLLERIQSIHTEIRNYADTLASSVKGEEKPEIDAYDEFSHMFADFTGRIQRLGYDSKLSDSGIDALTGMRSMSVFEKDMVREIERRLRSNNPFCLVVVQMDGLEKHKQPKGVFHELQLSVSDEIKTCLRTYDDAYRKEDGVFILCLKNTVFSGACAAINRINKALNESVALQKQGQISVSCSIMADQFDPKNAIDLANSIHKDIQQNANEHGTILQFKEMSTLQKYVVSNHE